MVDVFNDGLELLILQSGKGDAFLPRLRFLGVLVDIILAEVDVGHGAPK